MLQPGHLSHCSIGARQTAASTVDRMLYCPFFLLPLISLFRSLSLSPSLSPSFTHLLPLFLFLFFILNTSSLSHLCLLLLVFLRSLFSPPYSPMPFPFSLCFSSFIIFFLYNVFTRTIVCSGPKRDNGLCFYLFVLLPDAYEACSNETRSGIILIKRVEVVKVSLHGR